MPGIASDLELAIRLARAAGIAVEAIRARGFVTTAKVDSSPVTEADLAADRIITEGLRSARPGCRILCEESQWSPGADDHFADIWCVDPIDGTEAFIDPSTRGYAVQIAKLSRGGEDGIWRPVLGVVFEPNYDELFAAVSGGELIYESRGVGIGRDAIAKVRGAGRGSAGRVLTSTRAPQRLRDALFARGYGDAGKLRSVGVKVAAMVRGDAEIYPAAPALAYWDLAAPQVVLEAAGGVVTDVDGNPPVYRFDGPSADVTLSSPFLLTLGVEHALVLADLQSAAHELGFRAP